jgi:hypothetical protein
MDRFARMMAGLLERSAGLLPDGRRDWAEAVLAEAGEIPAGLPRLAWLSGGLLLVAREVAMRVARVLAFAAGAACLAWTGWPGGSSNSAVPLNRMYVVITVIALAVLPALVRRCCGPARPGWGPRAARAGGYAMVLALIAAKMVKDRLGSKLGAYFVIVPGEWALQVVLLLLILGYLAGLLILTSRRGVRLARGTLPAAAGLGAVTAGALYALSPFGAFGGPGSPSVQWWWLGAALPLAAGFLAVRRCARQARPAAVGPVRQGALAGSVAITTGALLLAALTSVTVALLPRHVPVQAAAGDNGVCQTCDPLRTVIPLDLRHEYQAEITVGQAGTLALGSLLVAPFLGAWLGVLGGALGRRSPGARRRAGSSPAAAPPGHVMASDGDRDQVIAALTAAFAQGRLTRTDLDLRAGQAFAARTRGELAALTADLPRGLTGTPAAGTAGRGRLRQPADQAVAWSAWGLIPPALFFAGNAVLPSPSASGGSGFPRFVFFLFTVTCLISWLVIGAQLAGTWYLRRRRPGAGPGLRELSTGAAGE